MANATEKDLSKFAQAVVDFKQRYERLTSIPYGAAIARTGDNQLMQEYGNTVAAMERMKARIEAVEGAWQRAKEWVGLGALPLVPLAIIGTLTVAVVAAVRTMNNFMARADIRLIQEQNPGMTLDQARERYQETQGGMLAQIGGIGKTLLAVSGVYLLIQFLRK